MKVSLVVATIGRSSDIGVLFDSFIEQTCTDFEIIVIDQNADDRLLPFIDIGRKYGLDIRHERMDRPSLTGARNLGIKIAKYEFVAFPDDDCLYEKQTIETVLSHFAAEPSLGCIVGKWVEQAGSKEIVPHLLSKSAWRNFRGGDASSISLFFRRELLEQLGGFDERLGVGQWYGAGEETDLILKALDSGSIIQYCPTVQVHHPFNPDITGSVHSVCLNIRKRARGTGGLYSKHHLSLYVILRGFIVPSLRPILQLKKRVEILRGFSTSIGRIEGYIRWSFCEK